jgi:hypothetical protein
MSVKGGGNDGIWYINGKTYWEKFQEQKFWFCKIKECVKDKKYGWQLRKMSWGWHADIWHRKLIRCRLGSDIWV